VRYLAQAAIAYLDAGAQGHGRAHNEALRRAVNRLIAVIPAAIVLIVAVSMGIGAALLGYPVWAIPLIAILGAGGAIVAIRVFG
jgi:membrane protein YdbS with pleckstrin-like domain